MTAPALTSWPEAKTMIPALLQAAPAARNVLDAYGLRGCGGPSGPHESLERFALAHGVPLEQLLEELRAAVRRGPVQAPRAPTRTEELSDTIYRPFFRAGIAVTLSLGAAWGVILLLRIAWTGTFAAATLHEVNAHGHAQIFGWVGLFVMGFAYQAFPRFKHTTLAYPRLAWATWWLMLAGLVGRSVLEPLAGGQPWVAAGAVGSSLLEVVAIGLFVAIIAATLRGAPRRPETPDYYLLAGLAWFLVQAVWESAYLAATFQAVDRERLLDLVATWQGPMREVQIHGFAMMMILGVSQRLLHPFYGLPAPNPGTSRWALVALNGAIVGEVAGFVLMRTAGHAWAGLWYGSVLVLAAAVVTLVWEWRIFARPEESDRSLKFIRAAYVWLLVSLAMLVFLPAYQFGLVARLAPESVAGRIGFSHAYYGAIRHAVTVGFISLMILGVAAKVAPTLRGLDVRRLGGLWAPFVLVNAGCAWRVMSQTLTDFSPAAYPAAGVSGLLELAGLAVWGGHMWRVMSGRLDPAGPHTVSLSLPIVGQNLPAPQAACPPPSASPGSAQAPRAPIRAETTVAEALARDPQLLSVFLAHGFTPLANPILRANVARRITIAAACRRMGVDLDSFLDTLNANTPCG